LSLVGGFGFVLLEFSFIAFPGLRLFVDVTLGWPAGDVTRNFGYEIEA